MKKMNSRLMILISIFLLSSCTPTVHHVDPFYNYDDFALNRIPLVKPIEASRLNSRSPWSIELNPGIWIVDYPDSLGRDYDYFHINELEKFAVNNGVIMAYSSYVDKEAIAYIQDNYYHWFVMVPDKKITQGFQTEDKFREYIQTLGIQDPDWQIPDKAFQQFMHTGCLDWFPDYK
jgi:hypothetical protein